MIEHFVLLIVFNMAAHDNDRLSHQEHKKPPKQRQRQDNKTADHDNPDPAGIHSFYKPDKFDNKDIIGIMSYTGRTATKVSLHKINDEAHDLGLEHVEVVGEHYEKNADAQTDPVFPEIFV